MRFNESEIVEDIQQPGHGKRDTGYGTKGRGHATRDTGYKGQMTESRFKIPEEGLFYREAYTTFAADEVVARLVNDCGLHRDRESVPEPGKIVFVHREAVSHQLSAVS